MSEPTAVTEVEDLPRRDWQQIVFICVVAAAIVAVGVATVAYVKGVENSKAITKVEHSACQSEPAGRECQAAKRESSKAADLYTTCISFFKAGYPCPRPGSAAARRAARRQSLRTHPARETGAPSRAPAPTGGDASSAPTGHSLPGRHEGGSSGGGSREVASGGGGHKESSENLPPPAPGTPASPAPTAPTSPGTSSSSSTERTSETTMVEGTPAPEPEPTPEAPVRQGAGVLLESVGGVVEEAGASVNEVVGGVTESTCSLAKLLCHE